VEPVLRSIKIDGNPLDKRKHVAIVDSDDNRLLAIATKNYKLILHKEVISTCESAFGELGIPRLEREYFGNNGARFFRLYTFPNLRYQIKKNDSVYLAIMVKNSYDLSFGVHIDLRGYREVCKNDLPTARSIFSLSAKHTRGLNLKTVEKRIANIVPAFEKQLEEWSTWRTVWMAKREIKDSVDAVLSTKPLREIAYAILRKFRFERRKFSRWDLFMLLTNVVTHETNLQKSSNLSAKILRVCSKDVS
jgi:hypothetical protein